MNEQANDIKTMEKELPLITVIVPIYNVEKYLEKCIESILRQTYKNLEIILVDDGSTDGSGEKCDNYALQDTRINVIHKENGGLSDARNVALNIMSGEYVTFIDSDDYVSEKLVEELLRLIKDNDADISCVSFKKFFDYDKDIKKETHKNNIIVYSGKDAVEKIFYRKISTSACGKLYKSDLFKNIRYPVGYMYEDLATTYKVFFKANKIAVSEDKLYYYFQRADSIMNNSFSTHKFDRVKIGLEMIDWTRKNCPEIEKGANFRFFLANVQTLREIPLSDEWKKYISELLENIKKYRKEVIKNRSVSKLDRIVAIGTYLNLVVLKKLGRLYKIIWP